MIVLACFWKLYKTENAVVGNPQQSARCIFTFTSLDLRLVLYMQLTSTFVLAAVLAFKASSVLALPFEITEVASVGARDISVLDAEVEARAFDDEFEDEFEIDAQFDARAILPKVAAKAVTSAVRKTSTPAGPLSKTPASSAGHLNKEVNHDSASRKTGLTGARTSAQPGTSAPRRGTKGSQARARASPRSETSSRLRISRENRRIASLNKSFTAISNSFAAPDPAVSKGAA
ncbi:hypothetical protein BDZ97DRAFT_1377472 [Flammula alnicola]|nr:hypothetical protein BDZ97DRAFT_1377472 [Flammula alnicola]